MKIKKGSNRLIIIFPKLGFVIKFAIIRWWGIYRNISYCLRHWFTDGKETLKIIWGFEPQAQLSLRGYFVKGFLDNLSERHFYKNTKNPLLRPTFFSFFGIFNIQKFGRPCVCDKRCFHSQMVKIIGGGVFKDPHHLEPQNFCWQNNLLQMIDYASPKVQKIIREFGVKIQTEFDPNFKKEQIIPVQ